MNMPVHSAPCKGVILPVAKVYIIAITTHYCLGCNLAAHTISEFKALSQMARSSSAKPKRFARFLRRQTIV